MWNDNTVAERLQIDYPIIQAGMAGGVTSPELVSAVSNAGGLGTLGAGYMSPEDMARSIQEIKQLTPHSFGVNVFLPEDPVVTDEEIEKAHHLLDPFRKELQLTTKPKSQHSKSLFAKQIEVILEQEVPVCSFTFGVPSKELVRELKKNDIIVIGTATTVEEAMVNEEKGVDIVVAQGSEAGGHRGTFLDSYEKAMIGTMSLIPQVVDHIRIPVLAAGGIMNGKGIVAALVLGAQGAQLGTAFVTSTESGANMQHKEAILNTTENQTVITSAFSGKPARGIHNSFIQEMKEHENELPGYPVLNALTKGIRKAAAKQGRPEWMSLWSGQSPRLSQSTSAKAMMEGIVWQVENIINGKFK